MRRDASVSEKPKQVGIWIRVSTEDQARGESPEHHEKRARFYAEAKGWKVVELYDLSGVNWSYNTFLAPEGILGGYPINIETGWIPLIPGDWWSVYRKQMNRCFKSAGMTE